MGNDIFPVPRGQSRICLARASLPTKQDLVMSSLTDRHLKRRSYAPADLINRPVCGYPCYRPFGGYMANFIPWAEMF
jgi:hypothetical protein